MKFLISLFLIASTCSQCLSDDHLSKKEAIEDVSDYTDALNNLKNFHIYSYSSGRKRKVHKYKVRVVAVWHKDMPDPKDLNYSHVNISQWRHLRVLVKDTHGKHLLLRWFDSELTDNSPSLGGRHGVSPTDFLWGGCKGYYTGEYEGYAYAGAEGDGIKADQINKMRESDFGSEREHLIGIKLKSQIANMAITPHKITASKVLDAYKVTYDIYLKRKVIYDIPKAMIIIDAKVTSPVKWTKWKSTGESRSRILGYK